MAGLAQMEIRQNQYFFFFPKNTTISTQQKSIVEYTVWNYE
jgi:hypothetical protein